MKKNNFTIPINHDKKIILLSDIILYDSTKNPIHFRYELNRIPFDKLFEMITFLYNRYSEFTFWWLETHEAGIKLWEKVEIQNIISIFKRLKIDDKFIIIDNNVGISDYEESYERFRIGIPGMIGFTSHMGFDIESRVFHKKFISLNRIPKPHRREIFNFLKNKYYNDSYLSFAPNHLNDVDRLVFDEVEKISHGNMLHAWPNEFQKKSFCNIVTESIWWTGPIHITEKIDKCFSAGQPFILVAGSGYLKKLKEYGFKTFDKWWDESYDDEVDYDKRISMIKNIIDFIGDLSIDECQEMYKEMIPILKHNKELSAQFNNDIYINYKWRNYETILFEEKKPTI